MAEKVIEMSKHVKSGEHEAEIQTEEGKKAADVLEKLSPEDFGKYKM